jgi:hypothetical protein
MRAGEEFLLLDWAPVDRVGQQVRSDTAVGVRRKVSVVGEDMLAGYIGGKLHQQAGVAQANVQWIENFCLVELVLRNVTLAKRRHPEIDERTG